MDTYSGSGSGWAVLKSPSRFVPGEETESRPSGRELVLMGRFLTLETVLDLVLHVHVAHHGLALESA